MALIQSIGHGVLFVTAVPKHGPEEVAIVQAMKSQYFDFEGSGYSQAYWHLYFGYELLAAFSTFVEAILFLLPQ